MITIEHLSHIYPGTRKTQPRKAIEDLTMEVRQGEFCILSGPNGSGKSTLFRILCGMVLPSAGKITIGGHDLFAAPAEARRLMSVVFQSPAVDKHLTVLENLRLHGDLYGIGGSAFRERLDEAIGWTKIKDRLNEKVDTLSGGLARQVELAKCLLTSPQILLLDEPTTGLDPASRRDFVRTLQELQGQRRMTVLMTSHVFSEAETADRVAIMKGGHLLALDTPQTLRAGLGREMVVVKTRHPESLEQRILAQMGWHTRRHGDELRLPETENGAGLPILERMLELYRDDIESISIKQPELEDVFIHLTGKTAQEIESEALEGVTP